MGVTVSETARRVRVSFVCATKACCFFDIMRNSVACLRPDLWHVSVSLRRPQQSRVVSQSCWFLVI